ncbi:MAG: O-methyltransferase [Muribaculaceae bacterium]|nr:O-methyltransferase [Muribaculaceae bacterium]
MKPELEDYVLRHIDRQPENLRKLDRLTNLRLLNGRMCSGHLQGRLLKMLTGMINPKRALELGTFSGYSALCIAEGMDEDATLDTFEIDDELEDFIREALLDSPHGHKVRLNIGDAAPVVAGWEKESLDLVFIDADKRAYRDYYNMVFPLVRKGGYIIADNTLWDGHVTEPPEKQAAQTREIVAFNDMVAKDERVEKVIIPLRDGLTIIRKL